MTTAQAVSTAGQKQQFCTFWVAGRLFGVSILDVKEIHPDVELTPVYHAPKVVNGYVNIRGQIHLILDLRLILGFEGKPLDKDNCLIIFKPSVAEPFGVLVDRIGDVVDVSKEQMEEGKDGGGTLTGMDKNMNLIDGISKLEKTLLVVLNARGILITVDAAMRDEQGSQTGIGGKL